jgi:hypothetical protein
MVQLGGELALDTGGVEAGSPHKVGDEKQPDDARRQAQFTAETNDRSHE